ncbi:16S rRNA (guanine(527)-N(7))-methyltransferase RsmG [Phenylobacterium immobile]|uniref:16S rRNA (guanine(527)-N(7))-methyltransferase RsmG n=1 Tax=Phenylobacterium immobile TaxID=21 RepID=UPI000A7A10ED|nr:16S rRNA (guanine(527)-N(7))-methyltransferase RsmG [Phenylobacterium immobile]
MSVAAPPEDLAVVDVPDAEAFARLTGADAQVMADLEAYRALLIDWNSRMNLIGPATEVSFWSRHAWDSAQLLELAPEALVWADLGAGAGLPGVVLSAMGKGRDGFHIHLVESMAKRCRFLNLVVETLNLPATVHQTRAENFTLSVDIVTARACAPLSRLLSYARPYLRDGAVGLFLKGQDVVSDMDDATKSWDFDAEIIPSRSDVRGRIVRIGRLGRGR